MEKLKKDLLKELEERRDEIIENEYPDDIATEIADSFVPVMTYDLLEIAQNDLWLATNEPEMMAFSGKNTAVNAIAGNIYAELIEIASDWLNENVDD